MVLQLSQRAWLLLPDCHVRPVSFSTTAMAVPRLGGIMSKTREFRVLAFKRFSLKASLRWVTFLTLASLMAVQSSTPQLPAGGTLTTTPRIEATGRERTTGRPGFGPVISSGSGTTMITPERNLHPSGGREWILPSPGDGVPGDGIEHAPSNLALARVVVHISMGYRRVAVVPYRLHADARSR